MQQLVTVYIHPDDEDLLQQMRELLPEAKYGKLKPLGAEFEFAVALIHLTAASIHALCVISERFANRKHSYILLDGRNVELSKMTPDLLMKIKESSSEQSDKNGSENAN